MSKFVACLLSLDPKVVEFKTQLCWSIWTSFRKLRVISIFDKLWKIAQSPDKETVFTARDWRILIKPGYTIGCCCQLPSIATQTRMSPKSHTQNVYPRLNYRKLNSLDKGKPSLPLRRALFTMRQPGLTNARRKNRKGMEVQDIRLDLKNTRDVCKSVKAQSAWWLNIIEDIVGSLILLLTKAHGWRKSWRPMHSPLRFPASPWSGQWPEQECGNGEELAFGAAVGGFESWLCHLLVLWN